MLSLILDTSTTYPVCALMKEGKLIWSSPKIEERDGAKLLTFLEEARQKGIFDPKDIKELIVGRGPGSYTGLRVGFAIAKAWGYAQNIPIKSPFSLQAYCPEQEGPFLVLLDARSGGVYAQKGRREGAEVLFEEEPFIIENEELLKFCENYPQVLSPSSEALKKKGLKAIAVQPCLRTLFKAASSCQEYACPYTDLKLFYLRTPS